MQTTMQTSLNTAFQSMGAARPARRTSAVVRASSELQKPAAPSPPSPATPAAPAPVASGPSSSGVTIEYQRKQAKALQQYFRDLKLEATISDSQVFGWTKKNEINNGRWVMMGLAIGLLTEFSTAVNFVDQIKLMISYMGIADIYD